jgi:uncharacterized protein (DUF433 family)
MRITVDPAVTGGCRASGGLRVPVATVVTLFADGLSEAEILADLPYLEREDIVESLRFAAEAVGERELPLARPGRGWARVFGGGVRRVDDRQGDGAHASYGPSSPTGMTAMPSGRQ